MFAEKKKTTNNNNAVMANKYFKCQNCQCFCTDIAALLKTPL